MGMMKFMLPNYFGIYLHDSPEKAHFDQERAVDLERLRPGRGLQAVRALAVRRLRSPQGSNPKVEEEVRLPAPVPVYMTYLTVQPTASGVQLPGRSLRPRRRS